MIDIFGHITPDTDSICASISLSYLKNKLGLNTRPRSLGSISNETKFALDYFNLSEPKYLHDVKLQIKDIDYMKECYLDEYTDIKSVYNYMSLMNITALPIVDNNKNLVDLISIKDLTKILIEENKKLLNTSYDNILKVISGCEVLKFDEEIKGTIMAAAFKSSTFVETINLTKEDILIVGDRHSVLRFAIDSCVKLIILVGDCDLSDTLYEEALNNKVNIIKTNLDTYNTTRLIYLSNYIKNVVRNQDLSVLEESDYYTTYQDLFAKTNHTNYPVVDNNNVCLGLMSPHVANKKNLKQVILVDHNEVEQTVPGIDEAHIVEIVDHHKIGTISTNHPITFRNMAVGSSNTIIYIMFLENGIEIPKEIAGAMLSGILSDTLILKSPTATDIDKDAVIKLAEISGVDYNEYGLELFKAGSSLEGKSVSDVIYMDYKKFNLGDINISIGQCTTTDIECIMNNKDDYVSTLNDISKNQKHLLVCLFVTDIIKGGSYIFYNESAIDIVASSFEVKGIGQGYYLDGVVSRKKQMIPAITSVIK